MLPHSTSVDLLPSHGFHSMAFTTNDVAVSNGLTVVSLEVEEPPHAERASKLMSEINEKRGRVSIHTY
jgi:hypothetical protein